MFGYVSCDEEKLTINERDIVGSFYCGLCMALKSTFGNFARAFTNMDCAYAFMLLTSVNNCEIELNKKHCILHPFSKRRIAYINDNLTKKIASATVLISYYKIIDDCKDEKSNLTKKMLKKFYKKTAKRAMDILPKFNLTLNECLLKTQECETKKDKDSIFPLMDISGVILSSMCENCNADSLKQMFFELGRFIYLMDAIDDYEVDVKKKRFNAIACYFGEFSSKKEMICQKGKEIDKIFQDIKGKLTHEYELLCDESEVNPIFDNLFKYGLDKTYKQVLG